MRIKLAILEKDQYYLQRIVSVFETKYSEKIETYSFTDPDLAISSLASSRIDVLIAGEAFDLNGAAIPKSCGVAYLVDSPDIDSKNGQRAICKFQKAELIYKQILSIYAENAGNISGMKIGDDSAKIILFSSPCGGCGTSSMAAACASYFAAHGSKVLYLNLEKFGVPDPFFEAEGQFDMSDIIYALKNRKANLSMKLESCVKQDPSGVHFFSRAKLALDMLELTPDDIQRLITELKLTGSYNYIIIDTDFSVDKDRLELWRQAHGVVWVGDGSETSNWKIARSFEALGITEQKSEQSLTNRICLIYNRFSNKTGKTVGEIGIRNIGGAPRYEHATAKQVLEHLSKIELFDRIV